MNADNNGVGLDMHGTAGTTMCHRYFITVRRNLLDRAYKLPFRCWSILCCHSELSAAVLNTIYEVSIMGTSVLNITWIQFSICIQLQLPTSGFSFCVFMLQNQLAYTSIESRWNKRHEIGAECAKWRRYFTQAVSTYVIPSH